MLIVTYIVHKAEIVQGLKYKKVYRKWGMMRRRIKY